MGAKFASRVELAIEVNCTDQCQKNRSPANMNPDNTSKA